MSLRGENPGLFLRAAPFPLQQTERSGRRESGRHLVEHCHPAGKEVAVHGLRKGRTNSQSIYNRAEMEMKPLLTAVFKKIFIVCSFKPLSKGWAQ